MEKDRKGISLADNAVTKLPVQGNKINNFRFSMLERHCEKQKLMMSRLYGTLTCNSQEVIKTVKY